MASTDHYPMAPEHIAAQSMLGGAPVKQSSHLSDQFGRVNEMYGSMNLDKVSRDSAVAGTAPHPRGGKTKKGPDYDPSLVKAALSSPRTSTPTDPRMLHATQPGVTRGGVEYYMGDEYKKTGETYADKGNAGNRQPVVYKKDNGKMLLLSGHHRATAALLRGEQFDALHVEGP